MQFRVEVLSRVRFLQMFLLLVLHQTLSYHLSLPLSRMQSRVEISPNVPAASATSNAVLLSLPTTELNAVQGGGAQQVGVPVSLIRHFVAFRMKHNYTEANAVADSLAKLARVTLFILMTL
ncbi:uncharacterized protein LOC116214792 isoform X2 [Punica granatum]|nr:uncharacterized protein LOC116214792 isoform X2 [Punica granatum]